jgi:hypothetical protein
VEVHGQSNLLVPSSPVHGETLGCCGSGSCGININLVERVCGFAWASQSC